MKILVTGGMGFIGSALVRFLLDETEVTVINVDKMTYAAHPRSLEVYSNHPRYHFEKVDICDGDALRHVFRTHSPDGIMHLAAETHVDRSIDGPATFIRTNVNGTCTLLDITLEYFKELPESRRQLFRFHHVSTDEVYGALGPEGQFYEDDPYKPNSPYSASKAASDHFVRAWHQTYGLPVIITNSSNNYGPYQFPEKLIPLMVIKALKGESMPVYGRGDNVRDWLYVEDHAYALWEVFSKGKLGECYLIGGDCEQTNLNIVNNICDVLDGLFPDSPHVPHENLISFVQDRPAHDFRYSVNSDKVAAELGWSPRMNFWDGLSKTVQWYVENEEWWSSIQSGVYQGERLGVGRRLFHPEGS
jgi:dTDP-glucose 4,6-dehydratase